MTPSGINFPHQDSGFRFEQDLFGGIIMTEIREVDVLRLAKVRGLLLHRPGNRFEIIGECDRNLINVVLHVHLHYRRSSMP